MENRSPLSESIIHDDLASLPRRRVLRGLVAVGALGAIAPVPGPYAFAQPAGASDTAATALSADELPQSIAEAGRALRSGK